jgi:hypothetical protein
MEIEERELKKTLLGAGYGHDAVREILATIESGEAITFHFREGFITVTTAEVLLSYLEKRMGWRRAQ